jgi:hypothetical protein
MHALFRQATRSDIPGMHLVGRAVRENPLTSGRTRNEHDVAYERLAPQPMPSAP